MTWRVISAGAIKEIPLRGTGEFFSLTHDDYRQVVRSAVVGAMLRAPSERPR